MFLEPEPFPIYDIATTNKEVLTMNTTDMKDNLLVAQWKISGLQKICFGLQSSDAYEENDHNLFFILSEELGEVKKLLEEIQE